MQTCYAEDGKLKLEQPHLLSYLAFFGFGLRTPALLEARQRGAAPALAMHSHLSVWSSGMILA